MHPSALVLARQSASVKSPTAACAGAETEINPMVNNITVTADTANDIIARTRKILIPNRPTFSHLSRVQQETDNQTPSQYSRVAKAFLVKLRQVQRATLLARCPRRQGREERLHLRPASGGWVVFYVERGERSHPTHFDTEDEACHYLAECFPADSGNRHSPPW